MPESLVFSGLEPCLAVTLACVPVLRPLLGRVKESMMSGNSGGIGGSSGLSTAKLSSGKFMNPKGNNPFEQLNDDSSQYQLRPVGSKHVGEARAAQGSSWSGHSSDPELQGQVGAGNQGGDIVVRQE